MWIWLIGFLCPFVLLMLQSMGGYYGSDIQGAWAWFVPNLAPTLVLMVGVLSAGAVIPAADPPESRQVDPQFYTLTRVLSGFYLAVVFLTIVGTHFAQFKPIELLTISNYWLGLLQGITAGAIGVLFTSQQKAQSTAPGGGNAPPQ
jgi:hypothetical protein